MGNDKTYNFNLKATLKSVDNMKFRDILERVQEHISSKHALAMIGMDEANTRYKLESYIDLYLREHSISLADLSREELTRRLYTEMVEYSFLTRYLADPKVEEININAFDSITVTYNSGFIKRLDEKFLSQKHAVDIISKLLRNSNMIIDNSNPSLVGHLSNNIRITSNIYPVTDSEVGTSTSIRIINPQKLTRDKFIENGTLNEEIFDLLLTLHGYDTSIIVAGETGSGKTTLLGAILSDIDKDKRIITIEQDMREFDLIKYDDEGNKINSVINLKTRSAKNSSSQVDIDQEFLLEKALTMNPDIIVVGEMKSSEAYTAQEAARTGHAVSATIHAANCRATYARICTLSIIKYGLDYKILYDLVTEAFPIIVFCRKLPDNTRKVMEITECVIDENGKKTINTLYKYRIDSYQKDEKGKITKVFGAFEKQGEISPFLQTKLYEKGLTKDRLERFVREVNLIGY